MVWFILGMGGFGIILQLVVSGFYSRLLKGALHPTKTSHSMIKIMTTKFTACYKLRIGVNNVDNFVDKYVNGYKICGIYLSTWEALCKQPGRIILLATVAWAGYDLYQSSGKITELSTIIVGIIAAGVLIVLSGFFTFSSKKQVIVSELKDYLENNLKGKLEQEFIFNEIKGYRKPQPANPQPEVAAAREGKERKEKKEDPLNKRLEIDPDMRDRFIHASSLEEESKPETTRKKKEEEKQRIMEKEIIDEILKEYLS